MRRVRTCSCVPQCAGGAILPFMGSDVDHLGPVIGDQEKPRIVALGTSSVFSDTSLCRSFWDTEATDLDNGIQAHLYTRPDDVLVVQVPAAAQDPQGRLAVALDANCAIWRRLCGVELASSASRVVLATGPRRPLDAPLEERLPSGAWFHGSMFEAVRAIAAEGDWSVLAFVCDERLVTALGVHGAADAALTHHGRTVSTLMDKGEAMTLLHAIGVPSAWSRTFLARDVDSVAGALDEGRRYVFKPTGGAAGIGVFTHEGGGASPATLVRHLRDLVAHDRLPERFQVQEFLAGPVIGASLLLDGRGGCRVLEVHHQWIDQSLRFLGARWTPAEQARLHSDVVAIGRALSAALGVPLLIGIDMVDGRVIELNPRITAAAPIAHLLRGAPASALAAAGAETARIDIETRVAIPWEAIADGRVVRAATSVREQLGTLVLPQGLNPFGSSRVVFVDDDEARSGRSAFLGLLS